MITTGQIKAAGTSLPLGTPEDVVKVKESYTGQYLKPLLMRDKKKKSA